MRCIVRGPGHLRSAGQSFSLQSRQHYESGFRRVILRTNHPRAILRFPLLSPVQRSFDTKVPSPEHALPYVAAVALAITAIACWLGWAWMRRFREETWREVHSWAKLAVWAKRYDLAEQILLPILPQTEQWWPKGGQRLETLSLFGSGVPFGS